jgi:hypothetical protein
MAKFRGLVLVGLIGLLAVCAPPAQAVVVASPAAAADGAASTAGLVWPTFDEQLAPPGPALDPARTAQADSQKTKNKLIAGGVAVVLLLIVIWGRRVRSHKRQDSSDQAKGK